VIPQAAVIPAGAPAAPYLNYIKNFIKILLNAFRCFIILQPFYFLFYKFEGPLSPGAPKHCFFCFYVNPPPSSTIQQSNQYMVSEVYSLTLSIHVTINPNIMAYNFKLKLVLGLLVTIFHQRSYI